MSRVFAQRGQRTIAVICALALTAGLAYGDTVALADEQDAQPVAAIGGLTLIPERFRYRPRPPRTAPDPLLAAPLPAAESSDLARRLDALYHPNRDSLVNRVRERRGLPLFTFWESARRCLFFGVNERGFAGINLMPLRTLGGADNDERAISPRTEALFESLVLEQQHDNTLLLPLRAADD